MFAARCYYVRMGRVADRADRTQRQPAQTDRHIKDGVISDLTSHIDTGWQLKMTRLKGGEVATRCWSVGFGAFQRL